MLPTTYFGHLALTRLLLQRGMAAIYLVAFLSVRLQGKPLLGARGLLPIPAFLARSTFRASPSLFPSAAPTASLPSSPPPASSSPSPPSAAPTSATIAQPVLNSSRLTSA